ncbi:hypothetical protein RN001_001480 [Aquatica leii]|uniref:Uncharacterized protein n=1 Tax=Aquatica leii TaxID=1421715 RepID=A0AAN7SL95_9COLE|nr:hypothetical protein RN001_001480 [Aquatica leii]
MKSYLYALLLVSAIVLTDQKKFDGAINLFQSYVTPIFEVCSNESSVDAVVIDNMLANGEFPEHTPLKCFFKCLYNKLGIVNEYGHIQPENMRKYTGTDNKYISEWIYRYCQYNGIKDLCEKAFHMARCTYNTVKIAYNNP